MNLFASESIVALGLESFSSFNFNNLGVQSASGYQATMGSSSSAYGDDTRAHNLYG